MPTPSQSLSALCATAPLVHCFTNYVAMNFQVNVLLAAGAAPAMVRAPEKSGEFARIAPVLPINIGALSPRWPFSRGRRDRGRQGAGPGQLRARLP